MNKIDDVCVMGDGEWFGVYYRFNFYGHDNARTRLSDIWHLFESGYDRTGAIRQADILLGRTFDVLADYPGEGAGCGNYFGASNAPFVYRKAL